MRTNFSEVVADIGENGGTMFWINLDYFSDEEDGLERGEGRLAFKLEERLHEWT